MTEPLQETLLAELNALRARNARVEADKAWEISWARRLAIALITYVTVLAFMLFYQFSNPYVGAIIPVIGFLLSTLALRFLRAWLKK